MKILSLFDGISCARVALERLNISIETYYASEVDTYAIQIAQKNYPDTIQVGDIKNLQGKDFTDIDILIGGSPCQDLSIAKKDRKGLQGERSSLFWEYVRLLKEIKPKYFVLENVASMPKADKDIITQTLGVEPIMINAALVSAQNRKRLFWTNIQGITQPEDRGILLKDILEIDRASDYKGTHNIVYQYRRNYWRETVGGKVPTLTANMGTGGNNVPYVGIKPDVRKLTPIECERLQCLPDNYTEGVSNTQRYKALGNAFNVEVIKHILSFIEKGGEE